MATPTDTSFAAGFDADAFRSAIRQTMIMGLPNAVEERATFRRTTTSSYEVEDPQHDPYSWTDTPTTSTDHDDIQIPVAVEFAARPAGSMETAVGEFDISRAVITILDVDYELVRDCDEVILGGNRYLIQFIAPPVGLFSVTVYTLYAQAADES